MRYLSRNTNMIDEMFDSFFPTKFNSVMKTDIYEKDGFYHLDVELPGYQKDEISLDISGGYLNISAQKETKDEQQDDKGNLIRSERSFGSLSRSFYIGNAIEAEDIIAHLENGVLQLTFPSEKQKMIDNKKTILID